MNHHHDHDHDHHHHHHHGEEVVDSALVLSRAGVMAGGEMDREEAVARGRTVLLDLAAAVAVEGMVLGHVKALLSCGETRCTLSVTRAGTCDVPAPEGPPVRGTWTATVNLISLHKPETDLEPIFRQLFA